MAKKTQAPTQAKNDATPEQPKQTFQTTRCSYRIERLSQYEFQAFKVTRNGDGSYTEEAFANSSTFHLVMNRVSKAMAEEAVNVFQANKTAMKKLEQKDAVQAT